MVRWRLRGYDNAALTTARWTVLKVPSRLGGEQSAAGDARSAVKRFGQMICLMHLAPHGAPPTRPTQMPGVLDAAAAHLPPVTVANRADASTTVTDHNRSVWRMFPVTHRSPSSLSCTSLCGYHSICTECTIRAVFDCVNHPNGSWGHLSRGAESSPEVESPVWGIRMPGHAPLPQRGRGAGE